MKDRINILHYLQQNNAHVAEYISSHGYLVGVEESLGITVESILNDSINIVLEDLESIGIVLEDNELLGNFYNFELISDLERLFQPSQLFELCDTNNQFIEQIESIITDDVIADNEVLFMFFEKLSLLFPDNERFKELNDIISYFSCNAKLSSYLIKVLEIIKREILKEDINITERLTYFNYVKSMIDDLKELLYSNYYKNLDYFVYLQEELEKWSNSLLHTKYYNTFLKIFLVNDGKEELTNDVKEHFLKIFKTFKMTSPGYKEYYINNNFLISDLIGITIKVIQKIDVLSKTYDKLISEN